jgi:hypothetical protein
MWCSMRPQGNDRERKETANKYKSILCFKQASETGSAISCHFRHGMLPKWHSLRPDLKSMTLDVPDGSQSEI